MNEDRFAHLLLDAYERAQLLPPLTKDAPEFDVPAAYRVLARIEAHRIAQGWQPVGRKIGFTNSGLWERYGVDRPMWARIYASTVIDAVDGTATIPLARFVQPRLEPEVVLGISGPVDGSDARRALDAVAWIAPGFEIVQSHFPNWKFTAADCTAAFGLHGALVVGPRRPLRPDERDDLAAALPAIEVVLLQGDREIERGRGANVLGGPAHALAHVVRVIAGQAGAPPLAAGEIVTTGTLTDAWPVRPGEVWTSEYRGAGLTGLRISFV